MDLEKLLNMQKVLDDRIIKEKGLEGQDLFPNTILALIVELSEFANEGRWFKHWSNNKEPSTKKICPLCEGSGEVNAYWANYDNDGYLDVLCPLCENEESDKNPLLEEYVDSLHFFLSIANQKGWQDSLYIYEEAVEELKEKGFDGGLTGIFIEMIYFLSKCKMEGEMAETDFHQKLANLIGVSRKAYLFRTAWFLFISIGLIGFNFTPEQIEEAYFAKNAVNHQRQESGY